MEPEIFKIIETSLQGGLSREDIIAVVNLRRDMNMKAEKRPYSLKTFLFFGIFMAVLYALKNPRSYQKPLIHLEELKEAYLVLRADSCIFEHRPLSIGVVRPLADCNRCSNVTEVPIVDHLSQEFFMKHHAYTGVPVLAKGYARNWSALDVFSYDYFKSVYANLSSDDLECQFFPYKTNFVLMEQVWQMSQKRAELKKDQWYVGWSNCVPSVMKIFRQYYERPVFLPPNSESSHTDWIFMGGHGFGAGIHVDNVNRPSWQAQIKGQKSWMLEPPPECEHVCHRHINVTMNVGDIFVVDTNYWYHGTYVHPPHMSITIGSEYD